MRNGASDTLHRAEHFLPPEEVFSLVETEAHQELDEFLDDPDLGASLRRDRDIILAAVEECRRLYREQGDDAFSAMEESSNEWSRHIGEALSSGYYADLAI